MIKRPPIFSTPKAEILDFLRRTPDWQLQQRSGQCRRHERTPRKRRGLPRQKMSPTAEAGSQELKRRASDRQGLVLGGLLPFLPKDSSIRLPANKATSNRESRSTCPRGRTQPH